MSWLLHRPLNRVPEQQLFTMREGSLYPALRVLEQDGFIERGWDTDSGPNARKVYSLTEEGHAELATRQQEWHKYVQTFSRILGGKDAQNT